MKHALVFSRGESAMTNLQIITEFRVVGRPAPQGSKSYLGKGRFKEQSPHVSAWRNDVRNAASKHFGEALIDGPVFIQMTFLFQRPNNHFISSNRDRPVREGSPYWVTKAPDLDKLQRSTNDALTGVIWIDDSQVVATLSQKFFVESGQGAIIRVCRVAGTTPLSLINL